MPVLGWEIPSDVGMDPVEGAQREWDATEPDLQRYHFLQLTDLCSLETSCHSGKSPGTTWRLEALSFQQFRFTHFANWEECGHLRLLRQVTRDPQERMLVCRQMLVLPLCQVAASECFAQMTEATSVGCTERDTPLDKWVPGHKGFMSKNWHLELNSK